MTLTDEQILARHHARSREVVAVRFLDLATIERIEAIAAARGVPRSVVVREIVEGALASRGKAQ